MSQHDLRTSNCFLLLTHLLLSVRDSLKIETNHFPMYISPERMSCLIASGWCFAPWCTKLPSSPSAALYTRAMERYLSVSYHRPMQAVRTRAVRPCRVCLASAREGRKRYRLHHRCVADLPEQRRPGAPPLDCDTARGVLE